MRLRTRAKTAATVEEEQEAPEEPEKPDDDDDGRSATPESDGDGDESRPADEPIPAENAANARKNKNTNEMQQMWEVPAVAHFCSLFRATFKLVDFDIEDLEEALAIDSDCAEQGGRSSLLVDLLIGLLKGCIGRRDITLLNYNQFLHDLLELQWVGGGLGVNPLGLSRDKANFHTLPVHVKVKLLHGLCEWRLERPDVETLTKNLTGESLRVNPLGQDDQGNTYWYFYGTRLYKEEPEPVKIRIATSSKKKKRGRASQPVEDEEEAESDAIAVKQPPPKTTTPQTKKRKRRPGSYGASSSKRKKRKVVSPTKKSAQKEEQSGDEKVDESVDSSRPSTPSVTNAAQEANSSTKSNGETNFNQVRRQLSARAEAVARSGRSSPSSEANGGESYRDLIERIYSRDEDEDTRDTPLLDDSRRSSPVLDEASRQSTKVKGEPTDDGEATADETMKTADTDQSALKHEDTHDSTALSDGLSADDKSGLVADDKNGVVTDDKSGLVTDDQAPSQSNDVDSKGMEVEVKDEKQLSPEPVGPPPYEQELLRFDAATDTRWYVVCKDMMDWKALADSFRTSRSKLEKMLYSILKKEFLPSIEEIYAQKEKEQEKKLAALIAKRTSDRLEVKRLQREEEIKELEMREKAEWERLAQLDLEKRRKAEQQTREQRQRQRELDRERQHRLKMRAKEV
uniref:Cat eye syndrome critical region protein 2 n=1 Tax=Plectus sambesii TaxID=2011161 RepID=A0A914XDX0_9BILA